MRLRALEKKDVPFMLEWMHNPSIVEFMFANFEDKTSDDCQQFIELSWIDKKNLHMAVVDEADEYMGTVSLKNICKDSAEFAIAVREKAMGKGFSKYAMQEIIRIGLEDMKLASIYWYVSSNNKRAIRFYDKNGYKRISSDELKIWVNIPKYIGSYIWYMENVIDGRKKNI